MKGKKVRWKIETRGRKIASLSITNSKRFHFSFPYALISVSGDHEQKIGTSVHRQVKHTPLCNTDLLNVTWQWKNLKNTLKLLHAYSSIWSGTWSLWALSSDWRGSRDSWLLPSLSCLCLTYNSLGNQMRSRTSSLLWLTYQIAMVFNIHKVGMDTSLEKYIWTMRYTNSKCMGLINRAILRGSTQKITLV